MEMISFSVFLSSLILLILNMEYPIRNALSSTILGLLVSLEARSCAAFYDHPNLLKTCAISVAMGFSCAYYVALNNGGRAFWSYLGELSQLTTIAILAYAVFF